KYCYECHSEKKQKGDVRFDTIHWKITDNVAAQDWQDVLDVLNAGDMPPEDEPQPSDTEFTQIVGVLTNNLDAARDRLAATGGVNPIRRLNKREYLNSVKHLMGINVHESFVPDDIRGEHFDTTGNDQYLDGPLIETYLRMGTKISKEGLTWATRPYAKPETTRREGESYYHKRVDYNFYKEDYPKSDSGIYPFRGYRYLRGIGMKLGDDPRAYRQLFGSAGQSKEELEKMIEQKRSVLDVIASDGVDMKRRVSGEDHERIEEYFDSLRQIELGLQRQAEWSDVPLPKAPFGEPAQGLSGEEEIKMMLDLIIVALQTNSTRVATYRLPIQSLLSSLEVTISAHTLSHYSSSVTKRADSEKRDQKLMELFAYFIDRLKATKDRNGETLYDTTIASYGSNLRTGHTLKDCPALLTGGGMENIKHGRHIMLKELTPMSNYWLTILQEAGVKVNQFNDSSGPLEELFG
ncbi:DUF1552 domain-containing protein, partial [Akkermansiaceae bacterium]|nr:DUF1552 domain-containing protein [Akkermansiaceae bacterium]